MAWTARTEDKTQEFFDPPEELDRKVSQLAEWVRSSKHAIVFTGAGISTSAGIPDFRSGINTSIQTGPGVWELRAKGQSRDSKYRTTSSTRAIPTLTHMTFVKLHQEGLLKCVISQNCDGLHRRSGMPKNALFELHGNSNVEKCRRCKREYLRDYRVVGRYSHFTVNKCDDPSCRGELLDTIIHFGENLPEDTLETSFGHAENADLCVVMGSSLTVTPAANIPERVGERGQNLVIVNLQHTPLDRLAKLRVYAKTDDVSRMLMSKLGLEIPEFRLRRKINLHMVAVTPHQIEVVVEGADSEGLPFSFLKQVSFQVDGHVENSKGEAFKLLVECGEREKVGIVVRVEFHSHYGEPPLDLPLTVHRGIAGDVVVSMEYNPFTQEWAVTQSDQRDGPVEELSQQLQAAKVS